MDKVDKIRFLVRKVIDENSTVVSISRKVKVSDGAGGEKWKSASTVSVRGRVFNREINLYSIIPAGEIITDQAGLLAEWNADIAEKDIFTYSSVQYVIERVKTYELNQEILVKVGLLEVKR